MTGDLESAAKEPSSDARAKREMKAKKRAEKMEKQRRLFFRETKDGRHVSTLMNVLRVLFYPIHALLFPFRIHGTKKIGKGAYIYVGNHYFLFDVFFPAHTTWEGIHFIAKDSVLKAPVLGYFARKAGVISVMRDGSDVKSIMESMKVLKRGEKISLYPEGTRNRISDEEFLPFRAGAAMLAVRTQTPIVPVVICNRTKIFRMTHVVIGEPFELSEYYGKKPSPEDYAVMDEEIKQRMYALRAQFREEQAAKKAKKHAKNTRKSKA